MYIYIYQETSPLAQGPNHIIRHMLQTSLNANRMRDACGYGCVRYCCSGPCSDPGMPWHARACQGMPKYARPCPGHARPCPAMPGPCPGMPCPAMPGPCPAMPGHARAMPGACPAMPGQCPGMPWHAECIRNALGLAPSFSTQRSFVADVIS